MAYITKELQVSETAYVFPSDKADYKTRFFAPDVEVNLCGHATIATFFTMAAEGILQKNVVTQETKAGILEVGIEIENDNIKRVMMSQGKPVIKDIYLDIFKLTEALKIEAKKLTILCLCKKPLQNCLHCLFVLNHMML